MLTMKLKYKCNDEGYREYLQEQRRMYSSLLHCMFNRLWDTNNGMSEKDLRDYSGTLNNIDLNSWIVQSCVKESKMTYKSFKHRYDKHISDREQNLKDLDEAYSRKKIGCKRYNEKSEYYKSDLKLIFGGKNWIKQRIGGSISNTDVKRERLSPLYSIGEAPHNGNRLFRFNPDLSITYKPKAGVKYNLYVSKGSNQSRILSELVAKADKKETPLSVKLDDRYIYISYDESTIKNDIYEPVKNRVFGIDMNPNYVGWSVVEWKSSSEYKVIDTGTYSVKKIEEAMKALNDLEDVGSDDPRRIYLNNKRTHETRIISYELMKLCRHYRCEMVSLEDLNMKASDKKKGKDYNALCNNHWMRTTFTNGIRKMCSIHGITLHEVMPQYSSFIGNMLFREIDQPDMVLASVEIGRRAYEYHNQYVTKTKEIKHNILQPDRYDFKNQLEKSMEEFDLQDTESSLVDIYYGIKAKKDHPLLKGDPNKVRLRMDCLKHHPTVKRMFSVKSMTLYLK